MEKQSSLDLNFNSRERWRNAIHTQSLAFIDSTGCGVGSVVRALDCSSKGRGFKSRQEHKINVEFSSSQKGCADSLSVCPTPVCMRTHTKDHVRTLKIM